MAKDVLHWLKEGDVTECLLGASFVVKPEGGSKTGHGFSPNQQGREKALAPVCANSRYTQTHLEPIPSSLSHLTARAGTGRLPLGQSLSSLWPSWRSGEPWHICVHQWAWYPWVIYSAKEQMSYWQAFQESTSLWMTSWWWEDQWNSSLGAFCVFEACYVYGIMLYAKRSLIGHSVKFAGFIMDQEGNKPDPKKIEALGTSPP